MCVRRLGIDLGGSKLKVAEQVGDLPPRLVEMVDAEYNLESLPAILDVLAKQFDSVYALGISCSGDLDCQKGMINKSLRLGTAVPIAEIVRRSFRQAEKVFILNDAQAAALAELFLGAGSKIKSFLFVNLGSNPGGAVVLDGHLLINSNGRNLGRIGHICVDPAGPECRCGKRGCLDTFVSSKSIRAAAQKVLSQETVVLSEFSASANSGEPLAKLVWKEAALALAEVAVPLANFLGVEAIVVGGGLSLAGDCLFRPLQAKVAELSRYPITVYPAKAECRQASVFGAAILAQIGYQGL